MAEYYAEEVEPVTRQGEQDFGWEIYDDLHEESEGVVQEDHQGAGQTWTF